MMKNMIIGTAGHVDHGKTAIIRELTGIECDRLDEEKKRGITIDLGFAHMDIPEVGRVGIVDVPGHEKFVRNMLSGASGMDMCLLVVDINEGVMPQTKEHMDILGILGIKKGILVLNKIDLMDPDDIPDAKEKIQNELKGTFLEDAPVALVSAKTGEGMDNLRNLITQVLTKDNDIPSNEDIIVTGEVDSDSQRAFFMPIDRAFTVKGFGTVVTGTIRSGEAVLSEEYTLYPEGKKTVARSIQVHSKDVQSAAAGQRTAICLRDVSPEGLQRGHFLAAKDAFTTTRALDVKITLLKDSPFGLENGTRVHFYYGTGEYTAKVVLIGRDYLDAGESAYAVLRFKDDLIGRYNDHFVIRNLSPQLTIGGGEILDANPIRKKRNSEEVARGFKVKESGTTCERVYEYIKEHNNSFLNIKNVSSTPESLDALNTLIDEGRVVVLDQKKVITTALMERLKVYLGRILSDYHQQKATMVGEPLAEVKEKLLGSKRERDAKALINYFLETGFIKEEANCISLYDFHHRVMKDDEKIKEQLENIYRTAFINPPAFNDMKVGFVGANSFLSVLKSMVKEGILVKLDERYYIHLSAYEFAYEKLMLMAPHLKNGIFTLAEYRDRLKCSRKVALALLEYFDGKGITQRDGEVRRVL